MPAAQIANPPNFETIFALMQENAQQMQENAQQLQETRLSIQQEIKERRKEIDRIIKDNAQQIQELRESQKETDRQMKESKKALDLQIGSLTNLFGEVAEYTIAPKLREKFTEYGIDFPRANRNVSVNDKVNKIYLEIDIILENGDKAMLVEVKNKLTNERINGHIERLEKMRNYADLHGDSRTFLGAVAGVVVTEEARNYALNQGFYLIEPEGEHLNITPPNGKPKEW